MKMLAPFLTWEKYGFVVMSETMKKKQEILSGHCPFCLLLYTVGLHFSGVAVPARFKGQCRLHCDLPFDFL